MMKITKKSTYTSIGVILAVALFFTFQPKNQNKKEEKITAETFQTETGGWGYKIMVDNKIVIKQDVIPSINKNIPFQTEEDARKTAALVIKKMKHNFFPTVTQEDLDKLNVTTGKQDKE